MGDTFHELHGLDGVLREGDFVELPQANGALLFGWVTKVSPYKGHPHNSSPAQLALVRLTHSVQIETGSEVQFGGTKGYVVAIQTPGDRWRHAIGPADKPFQPAQRGQQEK